jgi:phage shock protein C
MIGGVCGGLGEYFSIDPTLVRVLFIAFALIGGPGLIAYILLLIIVPEEPLQQTMSSVESEPGEPEGSESG